MRYIVSPLNAKARRKCPIKGCAGYFHATIARLAGADTFTCESCNYVLNWHIEEATGVRGAIHPVFDERALVARLRQAYWVVV